MPTVNVDQELLFASLGRKYTADEFRELCFEYGIELDEVTSELEMAIAQIGEQAARALPKALSDRPLFKIDIPANRSDLLCAESIIRALKVFLGQCEPPCYRLVSKAPLLRINVTREVQKVRPIILAAVVRNVRFTQLSYESFIALQDKLHSNICRKRSLASIGTHDLDATVGPFTYDAQRPRDISFTALNETQELTAAALVDMYRVSTKHQHLAKFLPLLQVCPDAYPVFRDSRGHVCSLPPLINSEESKITLGTRNVLVECTATDRTRAEAALAAIVGMLCELRANDKDSDSDSDCAVEPVEIAVAQADGSVVVSTTPGVAPRHMRVSPSSISSLLGVDLGAAEISRLLRRMSFAVEHGACGTFVDVQIPMTRSDVLHEVDVAEDVGIGYGYSRLPKRMPRAATVGRALPINKLSDAVRGELAAAGYLEVLPLILCSLADLSSMLRIDSTAYSNDAGGAPAPVEILNPRTAECEALRTRLIPGLLKTLRENRALPLPLRVFEVSDVAMRDESRPRRSRNERHVACAIGATRSSFEALHGVLDLAMAKLGVVSTDPRDYALRAISGCEVDMFLSGMAADITYRGSKVGVLGVIHPEVLGNFGLAFPVSVFEFNLEPFL